MLTIVVPGLEYFDEEKEEFVYGKSTTLQLEHSLVSLHKWERKWHKPYLNTKQKTREEAIDYLRCMTISQHIDDSVYNRITKEQFKQINAYIEDPMTATTFKETKGNSRQIVTAETLYAQMIANNIPPEYRKWHLNSLISLLRVVSDMNTPKKKMSKKEVFNQNKELNAMRRKQLNSKG